MKESGKRRLCPEQFKKEAVSLVTEYGLRLLNCASTPSG